MLYIFSCSPFYSNFVCQPQSTDHHSPYISNNPKFNPFFEDAIGAMDGTHFISPGSAEERAIAKGLSLKTVLPPVILITTSPIFLLVGKDQYLIQPCILISIQLTSKSSQVNTTLLMLDFHLLVHSLFLTKMYNTTLLSGAMQIFGMSKCIDINFAYF